MWVDRKPVAPQGVALALSWGLHSGCSDGVGAGQDNNGDKEAVLGSLQVPVHLQRCEKNQPLDV